MATQSTAVKAVRRYQIKHAGGASTRVLEVHWIDPSAQDVLLIDKTLWPPVAAEFISLTLTV